jgi:hypothetical protein
VETCPSDTEVTLTSVIVQRSGAGQSVFELLAAIRQKTLRHPQVHLWILRQHHDTLGNSWQSARNVRFDYEAAVASVHYYNAEQIPKIALPLPDGVSQVSLVSDFRGLTPTSSKSFTNSGALFRALF